jgi:hypothetical protein
MDKSSQGRLTPATRRAMIGTALISFVLISITQIADIVESNGGDGRAASTLLVVLVAFGIAFAVSRVRWGHPWFQYAASAALVLTLDFMTTNILMIRARPFGALSATVLGGVASAVLLWWIFAPFIKERLRQN